MQLQVTLCVIVGLLTGDGTPIGGKRPSPIMRYAGRRDALQMCNFAYTENEKDYSFSVLKDVNAGLTECNKQLEQKMQALQKIAAKKTKLLARLQRFDPKFEESLCDGTYMSHIMQKKMHALHIYTIYSILLDCNQLHRMSILVQMQNKWSWNTRLVSLARLRTQMSSLACHMQSLSQSRAVETPVCTCLRACT